ncbi:DinB family protein [Hymenobacter saemangeumensis]|uniref:DinB family protein n=1 Tax=Hymenobacter saemangeumensis TaxID=1084522 RepID=A0ABP8HYQ6_9BACT
MNAAAFLTSLQDATQQLRATAQAELEPLELTLLNYKPSPTAWSILECLEHLNRYSRYYNPQLAKALTRPAAPARAQETGYSWLGRKSVAMMRPENTKKQTTFKHMNPSGSRLGREVVSEFLAHQTQLLDLLAQAQQADLNRKAIPVEFFRLLKLRLGEALEFVVVHQQRHLQQALRVKAGLQVALSC